MARVRVPSCQTPTIPAMLSITYSSAIRVMLLQRTWTRNLTWNL